MRKRVGVDLRRVAQRIRREVTARAPPRRSTGREARRTTWERSDEEPSAERAFTEQCGTARKMRKPVFQRFWRAMPGSDGGRAGTGLLAGDPERIRDEVDEGAHVQGVRSGASVTSLRMRCATRRRSTPTRFSLPRPIRTRAAGGAAPQQLAFDEPV